MPAPGTSSNDASRQKKGGFFTKLKRVFNNNDEQIRPIRSRDDDKSSLGPNFGTIATRTRSRRSVFGQSREQKEALEAERELEERKSRCLAIQAAKRDPPAVQRLLIDCEFCNPPPKFGIPITIENRGFTAANAHDSLVEMEELKKKGADLSDERQWNVGLDQWIRQREQWLKPTADAQPQHFLEHDLTPDRYYTVFDKMIYQTRPLKHPLNLSEVCKILKAGWVAEGAFPSGSQHSVWTSSDDETTRTVTKTSSNSANTAETAVSVNGSAANGATLSGTDANAAAAAADSTPQSDTKTSSTSTSATAASIPSGMPAAVAQILAGGPSNPGSTSQLGPSISPAAMISQPNSRPASESSRAGLDSKVPKIHVQFSERPHPRDALPNNMPSLERVLSSTGAPLHPVRSSQSSIISLTDSD